MRVQIEGVKPTFQPVRLSVVLESPEEIEDALAVFGLSVSLPLSAQGSLDHFPNKSRDRKVAFLERFLETAHGMLYEYSDVVQDRQENEYE